ncbi:MAG TPA: PqiC family protein [Candidatus Binataceae bacterium]|nr:PqiC family protein [Candidatus Binataceae bacterium]
MTTRRIAHLISIAFVAAAAAGCGSTAPSRFYTLVSTATPGVAPAAHDSVMVGPVSIPEAVDRPQFVVQVAPNRVDIEEFNRWAAPLNDGIARAVAGDLAALLGTPDVAIAPLANFSPDYRVTIDVQRFEATVGQGVLVEAVWAVHKTASGETRSGRTAAQESAQGQGFDALAAAYSRALTKVSRDIAATIQAEAAEKP